MFGDINIYFVQALRLFGLLTIITISSKIRKWMYMLIYIWLWCCICLTGYKLEFKQMNVYGLFNVHFCL